MLASDPPDDPKALLTRFVDNLPGLAYRCDPDPPWEMTFLRGRVKNLTGYPSTAFENNRIKYGNIVLEDDVAELTETVQTSVAAREPFTATYRIKRRDGKVIHVHERGTPVVENGTVTALEGLIIDISQRKSYERRLERQNDLFAHTQRLAAVGGWEYDPQSDDLRWTDQVNRIHGLPVDASPSVEEALDFYHPEDRPIMADAVETALEEGEPFDHELRIVTAHDEVRWIRARGAPEVEDGEVVSLRGAIQDITDRREREQSFQEEQAFTQSILEALPDMLYAIDDGGSFIRWNEEFRRASGYSDEEIADMAPLEFITEDDHGRVGTHIRKVLRDGETTTVETPLKPKDGDSIPYEFTGAPLRGEDGTIEGLVGIGRDISGRKKRQRRFEAVFNNTYQFTGLLSPDGTILEANETGLAFVDADREDVVGTKLWNAPTFSDEATRTAVREGVEAASEGEFYRDELTLQGAEREAVIDFSIRPITNSDGDVILMVPEGRDISRLKNRERLLRVLHRLLRHNIRNDLTLIRGHADTLRETLEHGELRDSVAEIDAAAADLLSSAETAKQMVDVILDHSVEPESRDLGMVVERTAERLRERYPAGSIEVAVEESVPVACDMRIGVAIEQLIENGVEHNEATCPRVVARVFEQGDEAVIEISDNGSGMGAEEWEVVKEEVQAEPTQLQHGSGVGLFLARWTVDELGGILTYDNNEEGGTTVTVRLPTT